MTADEEEARVLLELKEAQKHGGVVEARLTTDERVIARVTDGIYRQPGSALRELISNAYDADATKVTIRTDAPRFERIIVEDNGHGMTPEALTRMLHHIGGSAKRTRFGSQFGITGSTDPNLSPGGRKLIGKIGIGLFSVSQMTHSFQIVTKTRGDNYSTVATVVLKQYSDSADTAASETYEAGRVKIWRELSPSPDSQGTTITLTGVRPATRKTLKSADTWNLIDNPGTDDEPSRIVRKPPSYYVGRMDETETYIKRDDYPPSRLPWNSNDSPREASRKLVDAVWNDIGKSTANPQLATVFDYYLRMIWELSLAIPAMYVESSVFDEPMDEWASFYLLSNVSGGAARPVTNDPAMTLRELLNLDTADYEHTDFDVVLDGVSLRRPIRFRGLPATGNIIKKPMIFAGHCRQEFSNIPAEFSGGPLKFSAYLVWTPKLAPTEHRGSLVRIHGASGTLFDDSFMNYQVAEINRMKQISCEIFVSEGLEAALNIDRESFNTSHPHVVFLSRWLHGALRQVTNAQKNYARQLRSERNSVPALGTQDRLSQVVRSVWDFELSDTGQDLPQVSFDETPQEKPEPADRSKATYRFQHPASDMPPAINSKAEIGRALQKTSALLQILSAFEVLDDIDAEKRQRLVDAIFKIMSVAE